MTCIYFYRGKAIRYTVYKFRFATTTAIVEDTLNFQISNIIARYVKLHLECEIKPKIIEQK